MIKAISILLMLLTRGNCRRRLVSYPIIGAQYSMRNKPKVARQIDAGFDTYAFIVRWSRTVVQYAIVAFIIALGYILYGVFSGVLNQARPEDVHRFASSLTLMGEVLALSSLIGALCFILLTLGEIAYAVLIGILGAALYFGIPILVKSNLSTVNAEITGAINLWSRNAGMAVLALVALRVLYEIIEQIRTAAVRRQEREEQEEAEGGLKKTNKVRRSAVWSPCWKLPYCHEAVRDNCPAYKARKSCWRFGYGCNCDPSLIERLIRSGALDKSKGASKTSAHDKTLQQAYMRSDLQADLPIKATERTIPCSKCPIYLDHQRQKFRIVNPIAVIATLAALWLAYKPLMVIYALVIHLIAAIAAKLTFGLRVDPREWFEYLNTRPIQIFFFIIIGLLALSYVLKAVEWAIFEKKL